MTRNLLAPLAILACCGCTTEPARVNSTETIMEGSGQDQRAAPMPKHGAVADGSTRSSESSGPGMQIIETHPPTTTTSEPLPSDATPGRAPARASDGSVASDPKAIVGDQSATGSDRDRQMSQQMRQAVLTDGTLSNRAQHVEITTMDGVMTLRGTVGSEAERQSLISKTVLIAGLVRVDDLLEVRP